MRNKAEVLSRRGHNFRARGYRARKVSEAMGYVDGQDFFDIVNEQRVDEDWKLYLAAKLHGISSINNPPAWLLRDIRADEGMVALRSHDSMVDGFGLTVKEEEAVKVCCFSEHKNISMSDYARLRNIKVQSVSEMIKKALNKIRRSSVAKWEPEENI